MADRPILFSAPMVLALLAGRKTQTRRKHFTQSPEFVPVCDNGCEPRFTRMCISPNCNRRSVTPTKVHVGDRLWVREHWRTSPEHDVTPPRDLDRRVPRTTMADTGLTFPNPYWGKHRQAMHMPRWASRITLLVDDVRVERLQSISEDDAIAEGVVDKGRRDGEPYSHCYMPGVPSIREEHDAVPIYSQLWEHINGEGAWAANPWVVAYTFRVVLSNIDQIAREAA